MATESTPSGLVRENIVYDSSSGQAFIPATQRPDGSWRKPRRVKDGYIPQDEVPVYKSKGRREAEAIPKLPAGNNTIILKGGLNRRETRYCDNNILK